MRKIHGVHQQYAYRQRRSKIFVCEDCGYTSCRPDEYFLHVRQHHPSSPALRRYYRRQAHEDSSFASADPKLNPYLLYSTPAYYMQCSLSFFCVLENAQNFSNKMKSNKQVFYNYIHVCDYIAKVLNKLVNISMFVMYTRKVKLNFLLTLVWFDWCTWLVQIFCWLNFFLCV